MKNLNKVITIHIKHFFVYAFSALTFIPAYSSSSSSEKYILDSDFSVTIHGTSNLHDWEEKVNKVEGTGHIDWNEDGTFNLNSITIKMQVNSIKSDNAVMEKKTYAALKERQFPEITFTLAAPALSIRDGSSGTVFTVKGNLTIAGITRTVDMQVKIQMSAHEKLSFTGSQKINMTDYGVEPPTALFGMLKTGDTITLDFKTSFVINTSTELLN